MSANGKNDGRSPELRLRHAEDQDDTRKEVTLPEKHVVFDFTGLHRPDVADLALILTARLQTPMHDNVWVRALDARTALILRALGLDHLFRRYPGAGQLH